MKKVISLVVALTLALSLMSFNVAAVSASYCPLEGLTPGFWKNHTDVWVGAGPDDLLEGLQNSPFIIPDSLGLDGTTMLEALNFGGGPGEVGAAKILLRAAVAAWLNASDPDINYYHGRGHIASYTNEALASLDRDTMLSLAAVFDYNNNLGLE